MARNIEMHAELLGENKSGAAIAEMSADLKALDRQLDALEREIKMGVRVDDRASGDLKDIERAAVRLGTVNPTIEVDADTGAARANLASVTADAVALGRLRPTVTVQADADTAAAHAKIAALDARVRALAKLRPTITVDVDTAAADAAFGKVVAGATAVGRLNPTVDVDVDTAGATAQLVAFSGTAVGTAAATNALTKSMIGLTSPLALGAVAAAGVAAAAALGPLAAGLAVAGTAVAGAAAGFGLLAGAIAGPIMEIQKFREAQKGQEAATEAATASVKTYEAAQQSLADAQRGVTTAERGVAEARRSSAQQVASATDAYRSSLKDVEEAARGVAEAERGVADARRSATQGVQSAIRSYEDSLEGVEDAEDSLEASRRGLRSATQDVTAAQEDLNEALADEPRNIANMELDVKEARLQQAQATEDVTAAEKELEQARRKGTPAEVRQAELDLKSARLSAERSTLDEKEAEDDLSDARRKGTSQLQAAKEGYKSSLAARRDAARGVRSSEEDLADSQRAASRAEGDVQRARAEGARSIREAQRGVSSAQRALADSQEAAARAEKEIARARAEGARQVRESQRGVADAQRAAARAADEVADAAKEMASKQREASAAGGALSAVNRRLYESAKELGPAYKSAFKGAGTEAAEFGDELLDATKKVLPALGREAKETVSGVRREFKALGKELGPKEKDSWLAVLDSASDIMSDLARAGGRFAGGLGNFLKPILPDAKAFAQSVSDVSEDFLKWSRTEKARDQIQTWVKGAKPLFSELAESTGDFIGFLISFGNKYGDELVDGLDLVTDSIEALFGKKETEKHKKDAGAAGAVTGSAYSGKFVEAQESAAKKKAPGLGERWGKAIGEAANDLFLGILSGGGQDGAGKFLGGFLKGINKSKITGEEFRKALTGTANPDWNDWIFGSKFKINFKDSPAGKLFEDVKDAAHGLGNWLEKWGGRINKVLTNPFESAYKAIVGNSIVPDLANDVTKVFSNLPGRVGKALKELPGKVGDIFQDAWKKGSGYLGDLAKSADEKTEDAQKWITSHLSEGRKKGLQELGVLNKDGTVNFEGLRKAAQDKMDSARKWVGDHLTSAKKIGLEQIDSLREDGTLDLEGLRRNATDKMEVAKENIGSALTAARETGLKVLGELRDKGAEAMEAARDRWTNPVKSSSTDQQGFMNNMLYGMGQVIEKAGLDLKKPEQFKVLSQPGGADAAADKKLGRPTGLAVGGVVTQDGILQFARGGYSGGGLSGPRQPKLLEWGEGDHDEAAIFITRDPSLRREQEHYASVAAGLLGGAFVSEAELAAGAVRQAFAGGGIVERVRDDIKRYTPHLAIAEAPDGTPVPIPKNRRGHGRAKPGSLEERYFGPEWATYDGSGGSAGWPPDNGWSVGGGTGPLGYTASGSAASLAASGAAGWPKGWITQGGSDVTVSMADLGGALRGLSYSTGKMLLDVAAQVTASEHEWGHMLRLGHGGSGIMGGGGAINDGDIAAAAKYRGLPVGGAGGSEEDPTGRTGTGRSGRSGGTTITQNQSGTGPQRQSSGADAGREFDRIWGLTTGNMPNWASGIFGMAEGGVLPGVPIWRAGETDEEAHARRILQNPPTWRMPKLVKPGTKVGSGEGLGPEMQTYIPEMDAYRKGVMAEFPDIYTNTYSNHPMGFEQPYYRERSIDHWGEGYRGNPIPTETGDKVTAFAIDKLAGDLNWLIWNGRMLDAGGWGPDTSGFSHSGPQAHVHVTAYADSSKADSNAPGGSSGIDIQPYIDRYIKEVPDWGKGLPPDSAENLSKAARVAVVAKLTEAAAAVSGGEYSGGGDVDQWITDGFKFGNAFDDTAANHAAMKSRVMQESGGNPEAVNDWDVNAQNGTPSKGLVQIIEPTWEAWRKKYGSDAGPFDSNWDNPVKSVAVSSRYMKGEYGEVVGANGQGYRGGGWILEDHPAMVHKDELYLDVGKDPRAATGFVNFLKNLAPKGFDSAGARDEYERRIAGFEGRGVRPAAGGDTAEAPAREVAALRAEIGSLRRENRENAEGQTRALVGALLASGVDEERARMIGEAVGGGVKLMNEHDKEAQDAIARGQESRESWRDELLGRRS